MHCIFVGFFYYSLTYKAQFSDFGNFSLISRLWFPWKYSRHQIISMPRAFDRDSQAVVAACKYFKLFTDIKEKQFQAHGISGNYISLTSLRNSSMSDGICHWARPPWTWVTKKSSGIEWRRHTCLFLLDTKPLWYWGRWKSVPASKRDHWPRHRPFGKCPLCRFKATGQLLYPAAGSNKMGCGCTWQTYLSRETNTRTT